MKLSGHELLRTLNDYFKAGNFETEIFMLLLFPAILILLFLYIFNRESTGSSDLLQSIAEKDMEFIETVSQQKGLEEFDRDFLITLGLNNKVRPVYKVFIDQETFEDIEKMLINEVVEKGENPAANKRLTQLRLLHKRLFTL